MISWSMLALVPLLIAMNAFFVIAEYALVAIRSSQIGTLRESGRVRTAGALEKLKSDMAGSIGAIQICITLTNLLIGWIGEPAMSQLLIIALGPLGQFIPPAVFAGVSIALSFIVVTLATVVLSELVPKAVTLQHTMVAARVVAAPMWRIRQAIQPMVWLMTALANLTTRALGLGKVSIEDAAPSAEEIRLIAAEAGEQGQLTPRERSLILNALTLGRRTADQIMVPRVNVRYLDLQRTMEENRRVMGEYLFSRMPLCDGGMDKVVGVIYTKEFLTAYEEHGSDSNVLLLIARPPSFAPTTTKLDRMLQEFHDRKTHLMCLVDEHGGVEGIVTVTDVVDELIGEMAEEVDAARRGAHQFDVDGSFVVDGVAPLHEVARTINKHHWGEGKGVNTVGGLAMLLLGRVPRAGDRLEHEGVVIEIIEATRRAARRVRVKPKTERTTPS